MHFKAWLSLNDGHLVSLELKNTIVQPIEHICTSKVVNDVHVYLK